MHSRQAKSPKTPAHSRHHKLLGSVTEPSNHQVGTNSSEVICHQVIEAVNLASRAAVLHMLGRQHGLSKQAGQAGVLLGC